MLRRYDDKYGEVLDTSMRNLVLLYEAFDTYYGDVLGTNIVKHLA